MISSWRQALGFNTFGFVVIAPYSGYDNNAGADLRSAQLAPVSRLPNIGFVWPADLIWPWTAPGDIHPVNKKPVGDRMAAQILALEYGSDMQVTANPMYTGSSTSTSGTTITVSVTLKGCDGGCTVSTPPMPTGLNPNLTATFAIRTNDAAKTWWPATATPSPGGLTLSVVAPTAGLSAIASAYGQVRTRRIRWWHRREGPVPSHVAHIQWKFLLSY